MIKGVTKKIIEINNPDSAYFEKAILYLRPEMREIPDQFLRDEANRYLSRSGLKYTKRKFSLRIARTVIISGLLLSAAGILFVLFH
ncbi:MAG: hypothetical protein IKS13_08755 [Ruminococcus sp.]|nr:hypothetical protein [Ruminococcus sp.]